MKLSSDTANRSEDIQLRTHCSMETEVIILTSRRIIAIKLRDNILITLGVG